MAIETIVTGLIIGILFGYALQRGRLCFNSAIRDPLIFKDTTLIKAVILAIAVSMIGFAIMGFTNIVDPAPKPFMPFSQTLGGFLFGIGMVLAAACASGVTYKTGEGIMTAFVGLIALSLGAYTAKFGVLASTTSYLQNLFKIDNLTWVGVIVPAGDVLIYLVVMMISGILFTALMVWKFMIPSYNEWKTEENGGFVEIFFKKGWQWWMTGIIIAVINMIAWVVQANFGSSNYPLAITSGWIGILGAFLTGTIDSLGNLGWVSWMVIGIIGGAFVGSYSNKEYRMSSPKTGKPIMLAFIGGLMLGVGAVFSAGCNITNILSGIPMLSIGSLTFTVFCVLGVWLMAWIIFKWRESDILE